MIDRDGLAAFLRQRRESLQPEDVGMHRGPRRRTNGLRREEVAVLCFMSTDYYARLERGTGPQPSEQMLASIAQGLHLSLSERDHIFRLAGHNPPPRGASSEHVSPGLLRIFDRLADTPAEIVIELGETLRQTPTSIALTGDAARHQGDARILGFRWFTDPDARAAPSPPSPPRARSPVTFAHSYCAFVTGEHKQLARDYSAKVSPRFSTSHSFQTDTERQRSAIASAAPASHIHSAGSSVRAIARRLRRNSSMRG